MSILRDGMTIHLRCLGSVDNPNRQFLNGLTGNGNAGVGLSSGVQEPFSGATWLVFATSDNETFLFQSQGDLGSGFLDGRTGDGSVGLVLDGNPPPVPPFTGTRWKVSDDPFVGEHVTLECLGRFGLGPNDHRFLDGHTVDNDNPPVALAPDADSQSHSGAHWEIIVAGIPGDQGSGGADTGGAGPGSGEGGPGSHGGQTHF